MMRLSAWTGAARVAPRVIRVARVLARHGLLRPLLRGGVWPDPAQVRAALEELGTVFLKFGQVLALRRDLLPPEYVTELERLHDRVAPLALAEVRAVVQDELGAAPEDRFASFENRPLAAATIAQVHRAALPDGSEVVVKIQRPGLERVIAEDVGVLTYVATLIDGSASALRQLDPVGLVREFHDSLRREIDFVQEADNVRRFRVAMQDAKGLWIPDVISGLSTRRVLTLEHSPGMRIDEYVSANPGAGPGLARRVASLVCRQVLEDGVFHADPHPGNVFVLPDGRICLHDFGMIGQLGKLFRQGLVELVTAVVRNDAREVTDVYLELGAVGQDVDRVRLQADLAELLAGFHDRPLAEISVAGALEALVRIGARHHVRSPGPMLLLTRAFFITEALVRRIDPGVNVIDIFSAELGRITAGRLAPERLLAAGRELSLDLERALREAPADARRVLHRLADGEVGRVHSPELPLAAERVSRALSHLTSAVVAAAAIVGGSLLTGLDGWHHSLGVVLVLAGLAGAGGVAWGAARSRTRREGR